MNLSVTELQNLIKKGESETLEFKERFGEEAIEAAGAFANTSGGLILVGVGRRGTILGTTGSGENQKNWALKISQVSEPTLIPMISSLELAGKTVVVITIKEFPLKPVAIRGKCYRRVGASNRVITPAEISELHMLSMGSSWDTTHHPYFHWDDLDQGALAEYVRRARKTGRRGFQEDENLRFLARKIELLRDKRPSWAAVIAFGKQPPLQAKVKCGKIRGTSTIVDDFVVEAPLLDQVEEVINYMKRVLQLSYSFSGGAERKETWEYPLEALREVVTNAICHRDYSSPAQIQIKIFDDYLSVWNPGMLPFNLSLEDLFDPNHRSVPRNRQIAMLFYDCKLIEQYGSGIQKVLKECRRAGFPEPEFSTIQNGFQVVFRKASAPEPQVISAEQLEKQGFNQRQIKALQYIEEKGQITNSDYQTLYSVKKRQASEDLRELVEKELVVKIGSTGKGTHYVLKGQ